MKKCIGKMLMLMVAAVLLAGTASDVAYAHYGCHSRHRKAAMCYVFCYQDGSCAVNSVCQNGSSTTDGSCAVNSVCQNGNCTSDGSCAVNGVCQNGSCTSDGSCAVNGVCQSGSCTSDGSCAVNGVCQDGSYCAEVTCYQSSDSHHTRHHTGGRSGHHSERGHRFHH